VFSPAGLPPSAGGRARAPLHGQAGNRSAAVTGCASASAPRTRACAPLVHAGQHIQRGHGVMVQRGRSRLRFSGPRSRRRTVVLAANTGPSRTRAPPARCAGRAGSRRMEDRLPTRGVLSVNTRASCWKTARCWISHRLHVPQDHVQDRARSARLVVEDSPGRPPRNGATVQTFSNRRASSGDLTSSRPVQRSSMFTFSWLTSRRTRGWRTCCPKTGRPK